MRPLLPLHSIMRLAAGIVALVVACATAGVGVPATAADGMAKGLAPLEAARAMSAAPGFSVKLLAAEPDIRQPIAMCFDDRGRLWVAECYYSGR